MFKTTKRTLAVLLAVLMLTLSMPFAVFAEGDVVALVIDGKPTTTYATVSKAIKAIPDGGTGTVKALKQAIGNIILNADKTVILDLNADAFDYVEGKVALLKGNLTIKNGRLKGTVLENGQIQTISVIGSDDTSLEPGKQNRLTIAEDATVGTDGSNFALILWPATNAKVAYGTQIDVNGRLLDNLFVSGNILDGNSVINVNEGATISGAGVGIALNGYATVNVKGGTITAGNDTASGTGIEVRSGNLNVTGGTITGNGAYSFVPNGNGTTSTGCGIAVAQHTTKNNIKVEISGDADVKGTVALAIANPQENQDGEISVSVKGGTFTSTSKEEPSVVVMKESSETRVNAFISGGIFSSVLSPDYFAEDAQVKQKKAETEATAEADGNIKHYVGADGKCFTLSESGEFEELAQADTVIHYWDYDNAEDAVWLDDHSSCSVTVPCAHCDATQTLRSKGVKYAVVSEPTCQSEGTGCYTATFENENIADETDDVTLPMAQHTFDEAGVRFTQEEGVWYAYGTCKMHPLSQVKVKMREVEVSEQTCEKAQIVKYVAVINGETFETEDMEKGEPKGHDYQSQGFKWTGLDNPNAKPAATVTFVCKNNDKHVETRTAAVEQTGSTILPTCVADGNKVYKATVNFDGAEFYDTQTVILPKTGHSYGPWTSNNNGTHTRVCTVADCKEDTQGHSETASCSGGEATCSAKAICKDCNTAYGYLNLDNHKNTTEKPAVKATCVTEGFTAGVYCNDCKLYISGHQSVDIDTSEAGHTYGAPKDEDWKWTWNEETKTYDVEVTLTCTACDADTIGHTKPLTATVSEPVVVEPNHPDDGSKTYTATAIYLEQEFKNEKVDTIKTEDHVWNYASENVTYVWDGYTKCTATVPCAKCNETTKVEATSITSQTTDGTCIEKGVKTYTAVFADENLSAVTKETLDFGAHNYGELIPGEDATCTTTGTVAHYHCDVCGKNFDADKKELTTVVVDALGHDFTGEYNNPADGKHNRACTRCDEFGLNGVVDATESCTGGTASCSKQAVCEVCGAAYGDTLPHTPELRQSEPVQDEIYPNLYHCYNYLVCTTCGAVLDRSMEYTVVDPDPCEHVYQIDTTITDATCAKEGECIMVCEKCGDKIHDTLPATGNHVDADNSGKCDTCNTKMTGGSHCKYCGKIHGGAFGWLTKFFHSILAIFVR